MPSVIRNALLWSITWAGTGFVLFSVIAFDDRPLVEVFLNAAFVAVRFAFWGFVFGILFTGAVALLKRSGHRLTDLSRVTVGVGGGIAAGLLMPLLLQLMNVLSGDGVIAWHLVTDDVAWAVPFGALAALVSLQAARVLARGVVAR